MAGRSDRTEPLTTRIGGGSARATAVAVAVVLVVVVWIGVSGRPPQPQASLPSPVAAGTAAAAGERTASPKPRPGSPSADASATPLLAATPRVPPPPLRDEAIAVIVHAAGMPRGYLQLLREVSVGLLETSFTMNDPHPQVDATFELAQLWTREEGPPFVMLESFPLPIDTLLGTGSAKTVIQVTSPARPDQPHLPRLMREGYRLNVGIERREGGPFLTVSVRIGGPLPGRELGDDGLIGDPGASEDGATR